MCTAIPVHPPSGCLAAAASSPQTPPRRELHLETLAPKGLELPELRVSVLQPLLKFRIRSQRKPLLFGCILWRWWREGEASLPRHLRWALLHLHGACSLRSTAST